LIFQSQRKFILTLLAISFFCLLLSSCQQKQNKQIGGETNYKDVKLEVLSIAANNANISFDNCIEDWEKSTALYGENNLLPIESSKYNYIKLVKLEIGKGILDQVLQSNWNPTGVEKKLGVSDCEFKKFKEYLKKGVFIKTLNNKISNILFNKRYSDEVLPGISLKTPTSEIVKKLGTPQFNSKENNVFGYKSDNFYIFFIGTDKLDEISVYRRDTDYNKLVLQNVMNTYRKDNSLDNMVSLIEKSWPDWDWQGGMDAVTDEGYDSRGIYLMYDQPDKVNSLDVWIFGNFEGSIDKGISLPENIENIKSFKNKNYHLCLDRDSIFEYEKFRIKSNKANTKNAISSPDGKAFAYFLNAQLSTEDGIIYIQYSNMEKPGIEVDSYCGENPFKWINDRYLLKYSGLENSFIIDTQKQLLLKIKFNFKSGQKIQSIKQDRIIFCDSETGKQTDLLYYKINKKGEISLMSK